MTIMLISEWYPDNKVHGANMEPTWVLSAPDGPHVGPMSLDIREIYKPNNQTHPSHQADIMMFIC